MTDTNSLILDVLADLVESVTDEPRRVLFKGVSELHRQFETRVAEEGLLWDVRVTRAGSDVVGARNDASIGTLVVFYRDEVRERESLNAFRQFDEDAIAEELVRYATAVGIGNDVYTSDEAERLQRLLQLVYPAVGQLAAFLLQGKANLGEALPRLGLFSDPELHYGLPYNRWLKRVQENHAAAVLRWREFLERGGGRREARRLLGEERLALLRQAEADPSVSQEVLEQVTLDEALWVLNPPSNLVAGLIRDGLTRDRAEALISAIKSGEVNIDDLPADIPSLSERRLSDLRRLVPKDEETDGVEPAEPATPRVAFCLEGLLRLARDSQGFPRRLRIVRADRNESSDIGAEVRVSDEGLHVELGAEAARRLSTPNHGASELVFQITNCDEPTKPLMYFSLGNLSGWLETFTETWPDEVFWDQVTGLDAQHADTWRRLEILTGRVREVLDPDWRREQDETASEAEREPNNPIYQIFDLVYMANRELFEEFLDTWLALATLPWRTNTTSHPDEWRNAVQHLLELGLAHSDGSLAVLPFYPLRLAWHRAVFAEIESWLATATRRFDGLTFEPRVLSAQLQPADRPRALIHGSQRLLEASSAPFFSIFVSEQRHQRARAPLDRARQKIEQLASMWPFSLDRLYVAFQPQDAGHDVHSLLAQEAEAHRDAAFTVRALVDNTGSTTVFDNLLFSTGDETTDLLTQEYHESLLPRLEYAKVALDAESEPDCDSETPSTVHAALLVDAFREEDYGFELAVGRLNAHPHWNGFHTCVGATAAEGREALKRVSLSTPAFHSGPVRDGRRDIVYVPLSGDEPEYLTLLYQSLYAWVKSGAFSEGAYYERVRWDADALSQLHDSADWVLLFDRTLEKSLFDSLADQGVRLIDFYPDLRGGYRLSVSSRRTEAVEWQLIQVLQQFFAENSLDLHRLASSMLAALSGFASGLLLKTLGGGSLAQELLGLYATYCALRAAGIYNPAKDRLIPLDDYQSWFGRRTQRGRRADLLVLQNPSPRCLRMVAVESKWYKQLVGPSFVHDEFGPDGQLATALQSLRALFDPQQDRLDKDYWQKTLQALLQDAPPTWDDFRGHMAAGHWELRIDGMVYVHQYDERNVEALSQRQSDLLDQVTRIIMSAGRECFSLGPQFERLRLMSHVDLVDLFHTEDDS